MGTQETTAIKIGLHQVTDLRWPKPVVTGAGKREVTSVPLPRLPWSSTAIEVPMGETAARAVERVTGLRKIFGYGVAPVVILLFVVADVLLLWGRLGDLRPPGWIFAAMGVAGVILILTGLIPDAVARATGAPYVSRGHLRFSKANQDVVNQLIKLNPKVTIS
ncbi:hypothetical protein [Actinoplanes friuliensis]|uniref:Uncharacterized protein n=1 Tax=Actinoplanes friuliensis DSM 7358 TaxID=1246995 RepID=U5WD40_9ACTN|nr:hypothetical protein [Actinoplanes friuliensis]AGZ45940.1 hypothetical protein AFR_38430 [Actinoplanes friuliensis DSM 7358]